MTCSIEGLGLIIEGDGIGGNNRPKADHHHIAFEEGRFIFPIKSARIGVIEEMGTGVSSQFGNKLRFIGGWLLRLRKILRQSRRRQKTKSETDPQAAEQPNPVKTTKSTQPLYPQQG